MRLLLLGGSFDPPHLGHLALLAAACRRVRPDRVLLLPAWRSPFKSGAQAGVAQRVRMCRLGLIEPLPAPWRARARVDRGEADAGRVVYTFETLERLSRAHPKAQLHFAAGSDAAAEFERWRRPERLRALARWWTARRPGAPPPRPAFELLREPMPEVSSTEVRERLAYGEDCSSLLRPSVLRLILRLGLYGSALAADLSRRMSPQRFEHSRCVARLASSLAVRWKLDAAKARLAGLLHDCGRTVAVPSMAEFARRHRLKIPLREQIAARHPLLLHAFVSEHLARVRYGVTDPEVLSAVRRHTLADLEMSPLDKVLYVADACSADRAYPEAARLRALAHEDLDEAFAACVHNKIKHCVSSAAWIHPLTVEVWNSLLG